MPSDDKTPRVPQGPIGAYLIRNLAALRGTLKLSYQDLSVRMREAGRPIPALGLSRIEKGTRRVDADDLVGLSLALGVNPAALLLPRDVEPDDEIELAEGRRVTARDAWAWADGQTPLPRPDTLQELAAFEAHGRPWWLNRGVVRESELAERRRHLEEQLGQLDLIESALRATRPDRERSQR
jgi:transcriptional regulator with XRE-family HTH domain